MDISVVGRTVKARQKMEPHSPWRQRAEWLRVLDLKSGGPSFKSSTLMLSGFVLGYIINIDDINYYKDEDGEYDYDR